MRVLLTLMPVNHKAILPVNYNYFLTGLIYSILSNSSADFSRFLHDKGFTLGESKKGFKLFTYSMLMSAKMKVVTDRIYFGKSQVRWRISSPVDAFIQHLITGVFTEGQEIKIGPEGREVTFLIERVETLPKPQFKETMRLTCLSPITISKVISSNNTDSSSRSKGTDGFSRFSGLNGLNDMNGLTPPLKCHYIRPWEEGFSDAIKNNLMKKYELLKGSKIENSEFTIRIDENYMNKKAGKIMKNIKFKGTNIIGFLAPFKITGNPELIEIGYETGFGEKGSMGFGMVKEII